MTRRPVVFGRHDRQRWRVHEERVRAQLLGGIDDEVPQGGQHLGSALDRVADQPGQDDRPDPVGLELERGDDPEVSAAAAQGPEQLRVAGLAGGDDLAGRSHDLGRTQVVAGQPEPALQHPHPAVQRQAADAGLGDLAGRYGQPEQLGLVVEVGQGGAALHPDALAGRVDLDAAHQGQVDQQAVVAGAVPGDTVAAAAYRHRQARGPGEPHAPNDVGGPGT